MTRYVTDFTFTDALVSEKAAQAFAAFSNPTPSDAEKEDPERYRIYRLCACGDCKGTGKVTVWGDLGGYDMEGIDGPRGRNFNRCKSCRGEGRNLDLVATCATPEAVGVALVTLASEDEFDECPIGLMDRPEGQTGTWLIKPWLPSARNVSDAGRLLRAQR